MAPVPAPTTPDAGRSAEAAAYARAPNSAVGRCPNVPPRPRSKITAAGTMGTTWPGSGPTGKPMPSRSSAAITPSAAASPYALPPVSTTAFTCSTTFRGSSRSVSRVPGPPPRTSTPPTAPSPASTTVVPVSQPSPSAVWCPIRKPSIIPPLSGPSSEVGLRPAGWRSGWHR